MPTIKLSSDDLRRRARADRARIAATTEAEIARHAEEDESRTNPRDLARMRPVRPVDVAAIRAKTGLSQDRFARAFQISPHTLRNWEQGRRQPVGPARALLMAIDRDPKGVMQALKV